MLRLLFLFVVMVAEKADTETPPETDETDANDFKPATTIVKEYEAGSTSTTSSSTTTTSSPTTTSPASSDSDKEELQ